MSDTTKRHYTDAEIAERLATAGVHPHSDARDVEMLRQVFEEKNAEIERLKNDLLMSNMGA